MTQKALIVTEKVDKMDFIKDTIKKIKVKLQMGRKYVQCIYI